MIEALVVAGITGFVSGGVSLGGVIIYLRWLRADIDAAHRRLDAIKAPPAYGSRGWRG